MAAKAAATIMNTSQKGRVVDIRNSFMALFFITFLTIPDALLRCATVAKVMKSAILAITEIREIPHGQPPPA